MKSKALVCVLLSSLLACGDDGGHVHQIPDSNGGHPDATVCSMVTGSALDYAGYRAPTAMSDAAIFWTGELGTIDGETLYYDLEFWDGIEPSLTGTIDLASGNQTGYDTCAVCVLGYTLDADGNIARAFFQSAGSINLAADPIASKNLNATFTGLKLVEISTSDSSPIAGGPCLDYADGTVMHDAVPNAWMGTGCERTKYNSGGNCTCGCAVVDPDCTDTSVLENCTTGNACFRAMCVTAPTTGDTCETAVPIALGATGVTGTTAGAKHNYDKNLDEATCTNNAPNYSLPGPDVVYSVALTAGTTYTVTMTSQSDMAVALLGPGTASICGTGTTNPITTCKKGADADSAAAGGTETFQYTVPTGGTGTYFIIVDSWNYNVGGPFTLKIQ